MLKLFKEIFGLGKKEFLEERSGLLGITENEADNWLREFRQNHYSKDKILLLSQKGDEQCGKDVIEIAKELKANLIVKLHPKENIKEFKKRIGRINCPFEVSDDLYGSIQHCNLCVSFSSTALLESIALGTPAIQYDYTRSLKGTFGKNIPIEYVTTKKQLKNKIEEILLGTFPKSFPISR